MYSLGSADFVDVRINSRYCWCTILRLVDDVAVQMQINDICKVVQLYSLCCVGEVSCTAYVVWAESAARAEISGIAVPGGKETGGPPGGPLPGGALVTLTL